MSRISVVWLVVLASLVVGVVTGRVCAGDEASFFVLKRTAEGFAIEAESIAPNETKVVLLVGDPGKEGAIDVIFPPSAGQSASLVTPGTVKMILVRNVDGELHVELRNADGTKRELEPRMIHDLARHNIRVSVTGGGGGQRAAYLIEQNERVSPDVGPVANMFAGRMPQEMLDHSIVVQTETYRHDAGAPITGIAPLELDRWPFVTVTLPDGTETQFLVDIGAGESAIDRRLLPEGVAIEEAQMVEYSAAGKRTLKYAPGGATGQVQTVVGHAKLDSITLGDLAVPDVTLTVLERMPDMFGRPLGGILGLDVMRRTDRLVLALGEGNARLDFGSAPATTGDNVIELPFAYVGSHLAVEAAVNGTPVHFILDTGAPTIFLDEAAAKAAGVEGDRDRLDRARGLDEGSVEMMPGSIAALKAGDRMFHDLACRISALSAFNALRGDQQYAGLLGNSFFSRFSRIEIDFEKRIVRFVD